jgi:serine protease Do
LKNKGNKPRTTRFFFQNFFKKIFFSTSANGGNTHRLEGSLISGIISAVDRTIIENLRGGVSIAGPDNHPLNSGNSGGSPVNYAGQVVGITTALVSDSQGLGFTIPYGTIP